MSYVINTKDNIRTVAFIGSLASRDLPEVAQRLNAARRHDPQAMNIMAELSELSDIEIDITSMENFAAGLLALTLPENIKIAFVAKTLIQDSYAESFRILLEHPQIEVRVFQNEREAHEWLSKCETIDEQ